MEGTSKTTSHKETNISTKCMGTTTTSNVHAILGTNFWLQRGPNFCGVLLYPQYGVYKTVYWNHVTPLVISPLRGEPNKTTINFHTCKFRAPKLTISTSGILSSESNELVATGIFIFVPKKLKKMSKK
ncbi:hypothetical protein C923_00431 [Plasmodium falciparum UGT5.1]|uniref:Uncharacterized protein n=1 Tax=Plasmodium falciparum UGT5.1 TaxID=1237627 RepID=W7JVG5_PLAFA|nr:hypothetical protein C923_00431 [Plasmodium falciparum UGT5.1]